MRAQRPAHVVLMGLMASGKSTVAELVAEQLGLGMVDNDTLLEQRGQLSAAEIARHYGVDRLHRRELAVLRLALRARTRCVVTAAASVADRPAVLRRLVSRHHPVLLHAEPEVLAARATDAGAEHRRLAGDALLDALRRQVRTRLPVYRSLAALEIDVGEHAPQAAASLVTATL